MKHANRSTGSSMSSHPHGGGGSSSPLVRLLLKNKLYAAIIFVGALITIINVSTYLHFSASGGGRGGGDGGDSGVPGDNDGDGIADDAHSFLAAHHNKKMSPHHDEEAIRRNRESFAAAAAAAASEGGGGDQKHVTTAAAAAAAVKNDDSVNEVGADRHHQHGGEDGKKKKHRRHHDGNKNKAEEGEDGGGAAQSKKKGADEDGDDSANRKKHHRRRKDDNAKKGGDLDAPPATQQKKNRRHHRGGGGNAAAAGDADGQQQQQQLHGSTAILDPLQNNALNADHDRNEIQTVHKVKVAAGGGGGGNAADDNDKKKHHHTLKVAGAADAAGTHHDGGADADAGTLKKHSSKHRKDKDGKLLLGGLGGGGASAGGGAEEEGGQQPTTKKHRRHRAGDSDAKKDTADVVVTEAPAKRSHRGRHHRDEKDDTVVPPVVNSGVRGEDAVGAADDAVGADKNNKKKGHHRRHAKDEEGDGQGGANAEKAEDEKEARLDDPKQEEDKHGLVVGGGGDDGADKKKDPDGAEGGSVDKKAVYGGAGGNIHPGSSNNTLDRDVSRSVFSYDEAVAAYLRHQKETLSQELEQSSSKFSDIHEAEGHGVRLPTGSHDDLMYRFGLRGSAAVPAKIDAGAVGKGNFPPATVFDDDSSSANGEKAAADAKADEAAAAYCDPLNADYTPQSDAACMRYLTDIRNMASIKVMSSILSTGRTIKMKVYYRHNNVEAVLKVSQKKFALEPVSEVMAFHMDRALGFNRVPPAVWAPIPIDFLRAAAAQVDNFYSQWLQKFAFDYETSKPLLTKCLSGPETEEEKKDAEANAAVDDFNPSVQGAYPKHSGLCLNVSLQLWLFDVHDAEETHISPPRKYRKLLNVPFPSDTDAMNAGDGDDDADESASSRRRRRKKQLQLNAVGEGAADKIVADKDGGGADDKKKKMSNTELALTKDLNLRTAASEFMDQLVFDYIIGNTDRWFGHNSFALGAWVRSPPTAADGRTLTPLATNPANGKIKSASSLRTLSTPRLAFIDQGSSFYGRSGPEMNPFTKNTGPFCRFKKSTVRNILAAVPAVVLGDSEEETSNKKKKSKSSSSSDYSVLTKKVKDRLPKGLFHLSSHSLLKAAGARADRIGAHIRECLTNFTKEDVMYF